MILDTASMILGFGFGAAFSVMVIISYIAWLRRKIEKNQERKLDVLDEILYGAEESESPENPKGVV